VPPFRGLDCTVDNDDMLLVITKATNFTYKAYSIYTYDFSLLQVLAVDLHHLGVTPEALLLLLLLLILLLTYCN
jgi:hypothetical protein